MSIFSKGMCLLSKQWFVSNCFLHNHANLWSLITMFPWGCYLRSLQWIFEELDIFSSILRICFNAPFFRNSLIASYFLEIHRWNISFCFTVLFGKNTQILQSNTKRKLQ